MTLYAFYFLSFLAVLSAIMVVFSRNPVHSVLYLVVTFLCVACHYVLLNAQFLAAVHVIVYAGAIMVLFLHVIMLLNLNREGEPHKSNILKLTAVISAGLLMVVVIGALRGVETEIALGVKSEIGLVKTLGKLLFNEFLLPFEIVSLLLLAAMVGTVMLGKTHMKRIRDVNGRSNRKTSDIKTLHIKNPKELANE